MAREASFPIIQSKFVNYANGAVPYLITNKTRLSITSTNTGLMNGKLTELNAVWQKSIDPLQTGPVVNKEKVKKIKELTDIFKSVYGDIPQSALTDKDKAKLRIFDPKVKGKRPKMTTAPYMDLKAADGGNIIITSKVASDSDRASLHKDAERIEMRYQIGGSEPQGPEAEGLKFTTFKKAIHTKQFNVNEDAGKKLYAFFRWGNAVTPAKSSPWSQVMNIIIGN